MKALVNQTVGQRLAQTVASYPQRDAVWYQGSAWSYALLGQWVDKIAASLLANGVQQGQHVGILAEITPQVLALFYAVQKIGAVAVMLNTSLQPLEVKALLKATDVPLLFLGSLYRCESDVQEFRCVLSEETQPCKVITVEEFFAQEETETFRELLAARERSVQPQDTAVILFTSGSTSAPKAVLSSHYSRVNSGVQQADDLQATEQDRFCVAMPMFHCFCISANLMSALAVGGCVCIPSDRHCHSIFQTIAQCGCTVLSSVPTMFRALIGKPFFDKKGVTTLRVGLIGGAPYTPEEFALIEHSLGFTLLSSLGQTECTAGLTVCGMQDSLQLRSTGVGRFMQHVQGKLVHLTTGDTQPVGELGEICVRGYLVMQGYYGQPEETQRVIDAQGWLHTGDLGVMAEDGTIFLKGRLKELIIRGGENISPLEIDAVVQAMPQVEVCKTVGVPDAHYGEEICVCVCCKQAKVLEAQQVRAAVAQQLAYYKVPQYVLFWNELPRTNTGKIRGQQVAKQAAMELGLIERKEEERYDENTKRQ